MQGFPESPVAIPMGGRGVADPERAAATDGTSEQAGSSA
jgi:hypothetical protein